MIKRLVFFLLCLGMFSANAFSDEGQGLDQYYSCEKTDCCAGHTYGHLSVSLQELEILVQLKNSKYQVSAVYPRGKMSYGIKMDYYGDDDWFSRQTFLWAPYGFKINFETPQKGEDPNIIIAFRADTGSCASCAFVRVKMKRLTTRETSTRTIWIYKVPVSVFSKLLESKSVLTEIIEE